MVYLTGYGFPLHRGGPMTTPTRWACSTSSQAMKRFAANPHDDAAFWQPAPLLAQARRRRQDVQLTHRLSASAREEPSTMTNAVIVSTARTPLAKSWKGAFNMTHGATLGGHAVQGRGRARRHRRRPRSTT